MVHRHGKTEVLREHHLAWNARKRCCKKVDLQGEHFTGIHDRFLRDPVYHESQLAIGWSDHTCKQWDELAKEDHTYKVTLEENWRYKGQWYLISEQSRQNWAHEASIWSRSRCHGQQSLTPRIRRTDWWTHPSRSYKDVYDKDKKLFLKENMSSVPVDQHTGWQKWL